MSDELTTNQKIAELAKQVADQCRVIVHLADVLKDLYGTHERLFAAQVAGHLPLSEMIGARTAELMEHLGEHLNAIDAVGDDDDWVNPIYAAAHKMFPVAIRAPAPAATRHTFTIPEGHEAVRDSTGRSTGETRPIAEGRTP